MLILTGPIVLSQPTSSIDADAENASESSLSSPVDTTWRFLVGNCVGTMKFTGCEYVIGNFTAPPTDIPLNEASIFTITQSSTGTTGNCSWVYSNSNGSWPSWFAWNVVVGGNEQFGGGTNDDIDNEVTAITTPYFTNICAVFAYGIDGENFCIQETAPPAQGCMQWGEGEKTSQTTVTTERKESRKEVEEE